MWVSQTYLGNLGDNADVFCTISGKITRGRKEYQSASSVASQRLGTHFEIKFPRLHQWMITGILSEKK